MKLLLLLPVVFTMSSSFSFVPGHNSDYVEGKSRYIWVPNGYDVPCLVDLQEPVDIDLLHSRNGNDNQYWLYTRQNPKSPQLLIHGNINSIRSSHYVASKSLNVIVHGWSSNAKSEINPAITGAFLAVQDANVIVVDWSRLANRRYPTAVSGVPSVGRHLGNFLIWLINTAGGSWNNLHLVGFSLGAHVVGTAGRTAGGRPMRVTGLDPAGPGWHNNKDVLSTNAGQYVEAIHTDGGLLGIFKRVAHADFYPNGGINPQPGCWISTCSHSRSWDLFASTVRNDHLVGRQCSSIRDARISKCSGEAFNMGNGNLSKQGRGIYGLTTRYSWPY